MKDKLKYTVLFIISFLLANTLLILLAKRFVIEKGKVFVTIAYQAFSEEDLSLYWNDGKGFSDKDHITLKTKVDKLFYAFTIEAVDSLLELRIDPDSKLNLALLRDIKIRGLDKPVQISNFSKYSSNGLFTIQQKDVCLLQRKQKNSDPYLVIKLPKGARALKSTYSAKDLFFILLCSFISFTLILFFRNRFMDRFETFQLQRSLLICFFLLITSSYWSNLILNYYSAPPSLENRSLARKPNFDSLVHQPKKYFSSYTDWFGDHYSFKQALVYANSFLKINVFKVSPMPSSMYIGKNFQFFSANSLLTDDVTGKRKLSQDEIQSLFATGLFKQKYLSHHNIAYYLTIPPSKQTVYEDLLPEYLLLQCKNIKMTQQFTDEIIKRKADFYIDVVQVLKERHLLFPKENVFYQFDLHWSDWGAFLAYRQLINSIYKDHPWVGRALNENEIKIDTVFEENADLAKLIVMQKTFKKERYVIRSKYSDTLSETVVNGIYQYPIYKYRNQKAKGRVLVFRDSYSEQWKWLIARHFNESVFIWDQKISQKLIDEYKPDIVIQENCEMFLFYLFNPIKTNE